MTTELAVVKMVAEALISAGAQVSVFDGEEIFPKRTRDLNAIMQAVMSTDQDQFFVYMPDDGTRRMVLFVYGNSAGEVIADYSTALEEVLKPVLEYCDQIYNS